MVFYHLFTGKDIILHFIWLVSKSVIWTDYFCYIIIDLSVPVSVISFWSQGLYLVRVQIFIKWVLLNIRFNGIVAKKKPFLISNWTVVKSREKSELREEQFLQQVIFSIYLYLQ